MRSYDRAMWLRRTRKGWAAPKRCANGHELRGGTCLVGTPASLPRAPCSVLKVTSAVLLSL